MKVSFQQIQNLWLSLHLLTPYTQFLLLSFFNIVTLIAANGIHDLNGNIIEGLAPEEIAVGASGKLSDRDPTIELYRDQEIHTRGGAPYVPPANMQYDTSGGPKEGMINVHLVPYTWIYFFFLFEMLITLYTHTNTVTLMTIRDGKWLLISTFSERCTTLWILSFRIFSWIRIENSSTWRLDFLRGGGMTWTRSREIRRNIWWNEDSSNSSTEVGARL